MPYLIIHGVWKPLGLRCVILHHSKGHDALPRLALGSLDAPEYSFAIQKSLWRTHCTRPSPAVAISPSLEVIKLSLRLLRRGNLAGHAAARHIGRPAHIPGRHKESHSPTMPPRHASHNPHESTSADCPACEQPTQILHGDVQGHSITPST